MVKNIHPSTVQIDRLPQIKYTLEIWNKAKLASLRREVSKLWDTSVHLKRGCAASLNVREHAGENKIDMEKNI